MLCCPLGPGQQPIDLGEGFASKVKDLNDADELESLDDGVSENVSTEPHNDTEPNNDSEPIRPAELTEAVEAPEETPSPLPSEYLFISANEENGSVQTIESLITVLRYVADNRPQIGNNIAEAAQAENVIVVGNVADDLLAMLADAGATIDHVSDNFVQLFERLTPKQ